MIVNAENMILGRLATYIAKKALTGEKIDVVNAEKAVIVGKRRDILQKYKIRMERGHPYKGPFYPRHPERFVKRTIRGMLPYKLKKGRTAFENIKCYIGIPEQLKDKKLETINDIKVKEYHMNFIQVKDLVKELGYNG